jgi:hypothetical protein
MAMGEAAEEGRTQSQAEDIYTRYIIMIWMIFFGKRIPVFNGHPWANDYWYTMYNVS